MEEKNEKFEQTEQKEPLNIHTVFAALGDLTPESTPRYAPTDVGNANLFGDVYSDRLRYVPERRLWYVYTGRRWEPDVGGLMAMELCKDLAEALYIYMLRLDDKSTTWNGTRQQLVHAADRWRQRRAREIILKDAQGVYPAKLSDFDRDPWLFNCQNGTLDLRTNAFRPHDPKDMLSTIAGVDYDPEADPALWERTVSDAMKGDPDLECYLQKALGYGLTGDTSEECFFLLYGPTTRNGKGTVMETYMKMLGGYGKAARPETIALRQNFNASGPTEDIAKLCGARAVNISEPDKQLVLSASMVKTLTGNDTMTARFLNENSFEFKPQFKLFINTNHLPRAADVTIFSSGRVKVLPFDRHFAPEEQDKTLKKRLEGELSGVLNWCLEGLWLMGETGFDPPESVLSATARYQHDSDKLSRFVEECLTPDPEGEVRTAEAYTAYKQWCAKNGHRVDSMQSFKQGLEQFGEIKKKRPQGDSGASPTMYLCGYNLDNSMM